MRTYRKILQRDLLPEECEILYPGSAQKIVILSDQDGETLEIVKTGLRHDPDGKTFFTTNELTDDEIKHVLAKKDGVTPEEIELK